jgi:hypothetical protein
MEKHTSTLGLRKHQRKKEYSGRLRVILKSEMNAKNKIIAIAALAIP